MPIAPPRIGTPTIGLPHLPVRPPVTIDPVTGQPSVVAGMPWREAEALAIAGLPVRRAAWRKWLLYDPAVFTWIILEPVVSGTPTRDPLRVVRNFDFGAFEFRASDWTVSPWADGDAPPNFPPGGPGPGTGLFEFPFPVSASPDSPVVRLELSLPLIDPETVCLVGDGTTKIRARVTIVGGTTTAVGEVTLTLGAEEVTLPAWPGADLVHDFEVEYSPGDEFEVEASYVNGSTTDVAETIAIPGECVEYGIDFSGEMTETSSPPEAYEDAEGYVREESYDVLAYYRTSAGDGIKRAKLVELTGTPDALIHGTVTPGASYTRPAEFPAELDLEIDSGDVVGIAPVVKQFPPAVTSPYFTRAVSETWSYL